MALRARLSNALRDDVLANAVYCQAMRHDDQKQYLTAAQRALVDELRAWVQSHAAKPGEPTRPISAFLEDVTYARNELRKAGVPLARALSLIP